jgi:hypothetical protein
VIRSISNAHRNEVTEPKKKSTRQRRTRGRRRPTPARVAARPAEVKPEPQPEPAPVAVALPVEPAGEPPADVPLANPEIEFAARAAARPPEPERPFPVTRRAIFFDVENTSRVQHIARVIDYLSVDRLGRRTDFVAVGNWRVIGHDTARLLAGHGAQLLHSAPSVGVKDWSDLRIAVGAGVWLGTARPGDILEIISDDRAFDAVGDVATGLGIAFRRLSYRGLTGLPREVVEPAPVAAAAEPRGESHGARRRRGRRGGRGRREAPVVHAAPQPAARQVAVAEAHTAPHDELLGVARDLIRVSSNGTVTLDTLANALKSRGFSRPPGSPRLITRLRRLRELSVSRSGHITLVDAHGVEPASTTAQPQPPVAPPAGDAQPSAAVSQAPTAATPAEEDEDRDLPNGNRRDDRPLEARRAEVEAAQRYRGADAPRATPASDGGRDEGNPRRRSRRGGRRHRRHSAPAAS